MSRLLKPPTPSKNHLTIFCPDGQQMQIFNHFLGTNILSLKVSKTRCEGGFFASSLLGVEPLLPLRTGAFCPRRRCPFIDQSHQSGQMHKTRTNSRLLHGILPENAENPPFRVFCQTPALPCSASNVQSSSNDRELQLRQVFREMTLYERE